MLKTGSLRSKLASDDLKEAVLESYAQKDTFSFRGIFDPDKIKGATFWKPGPGDHIIDILPYLAGSKNPRRRKGKAAYIVDIFVHRGVGPNEDQYVCLSKSYNESCPICEYRMERVKEGDATEEEIKALKPSRRAIYAIWDGDDQKKGVQIWEVAHWFMENPIQSIAKKKGRAGKGDTGHVDFPHPDEGKSVAFEIKTIGKNRDYVGHQFVDRDEAIPDEILEATPIVDELLYIPSYDEVHAAFFGASAGDVAEIADKTKGGEEEVEEEFEEDIEEEEIEETATPDPKSTKPKVKASDKFPVCPYAEFGSVYGENFDQYDECNSCVLRVGCQELLLSTTKGGEPEQETPKKAPKFKPIPKK